MYLECMDPDDLYSFTYDHILENKGTLCMRFEKTFSGYIFERTEHHTDSVSVSGPSLQTLFGSFLSLSHANTITPHCFLPCCL